MESPAMEMGLNLIHEVLAKDEPPSGYLRDHFPG
jgi:hypothetical protein